jgi:hypothetical protein
MDTRALPSYVTNRDLFPTAALAAGPPLGAGAPPDRYTLQQAASAQDEIRALWMLMRARMSYDEGEVRDFVRGVYRIFGAATWSQRPVGPPQPNDPTPELTVFPDAAAAARCAGAPRGDLAARYREALLPLKVVRLNTPLDGGPFAAGSPAQAVAALLAQVPRPWAALTDGGRWRLYRRLDPPDPARYLEIDLEAILATQAPAARQAAFLWFFACFRPAAFPQGATPGALAALWPEPAAPAARATGRRFTPQGPMSFPDAAARVLETMRDRRPLHYRALTERALAAGWIASHGRDPAATMLAAINREIARSQARGAPSRFVREDGGRVSLSSWGAPGGAP